jgi:hypothetical protein
MVSYVDYIFDEAVPSGYCKSFEEYLADLPSEEARRQAVKEYEDAFNCPGTPEAFLEWASSIPKETIRNYLNGSGETPKSNQKLASSKNNG